MIFEFFPPEITNIKLSCQAKSAYIHKQVQMDVSNYSKMLVQINNSKNTPDYIYLTMHGTSKTSPVNAHLIVYGIKDLSDNVKPEIYDHQIFEGMFEYDDGDMKMNTDIDMNNHHITNLNDGTDDTDAVTKIQLDGVSYYVKDHTYRVIFKNNFYDLLETSRFSISQSASGVVIQGVEPSLFFGTDRFINNYDRVKGLQINNGYINLKNNVNQNSDYTILISLFFTKDFELHFSNNTSGSNGYYPKFHLNSTTNTFAIKESPTKLYYKSFTSEYKNKQIMLWICHNGTTNLSKFGI